MKTKKQIAQKPGPTRAPSMDGVEALISYGLLAAGLLFTTWVRLRYLHLPLERDEGEFAYIAHRILAGLSPFEAYNYKLPGVPCVYAFFMLFWGQTIAAVHLALLFANLGASWLLFVVFRGILGGCWAAVAAVTYSLLSLDFTVLGTAAHATQFVVLFLLASCFFLMRARPGTMHSLLAGLMAGLSFTMKQPAFLFVAWGAIFLLHLHLDRKPRVRKSALIQVLVYSAGAAAPYLAVVIYALRLHEFDLFWKWTFTYPGYYVSALSYTQGWDNFKVIFGAIFDRFPLLWCLAGAGILAYALDRKLSATLRIMIPALFVVSLLAIVPGYYFHHHYFIMLLPAASLCTGKAFQLIKRAVNDKGVTGTIAALSAFLLIAGFGVSSGTAFYFRYSNDDYQAFRYIHNPFREAMKAADYIRSITSDKDKILVAGSEAEIYFYAQREAATGYLFVHGLVSNQPRNVEMQNEFISEAERSRPEVMVLCGVAYSWLMQPGAPDSVLRWFDRYSGANYDIVGIIDMLDQGTVYKWGSESRGYFPQAPNYLVIYKKTKL